MRNILFFLAAMFLTTAGFAQIQDPVNWTFSAKKIKEGSYEIRMSASIERGWHIYSQTTPDGGPIPTTITFTKNPLISVDGKTKEVGKLEQKHEELFGVDVKQYSDKVEFVQVVKLKGKVKTSVTGSVEFMVCNDSQCLPPSTKKFSLEIK